MPFKTKRIRHKEYPKGYGFLCSAAQHVECLEKIAQDEWITSKSTHTDQDLPVHQNPASVPPTVFLLQETVVHNINQYIIVLFTATGFFH